MCVYPVYYSVSYSNKYIILCLVWTTSSDNDEDLNEYTVFKHIIKNDTLPLVML